MASRTIKVSEENYKWLLGLAADLQKKREEKVSFDDTLGDLKDKKKGDILELAGSWKMSDKEWKELNKSLRRGWKKWKTRSV